jgi:iron complex outermembrane receptor protein
MRRIAVCALVAALCGAGALPAFAQATSDQHPGVPPLPTVSVRVVDADTGEPLAGAIVRRAETRSLALTDASGRASLPVDGTNAVHLRVELIGYEPAGIDAIPGDPVAIVHLKATAIPIAGAEVNSHLATEGKSPTAFTDLSREDIARDYRGQDLPMLLATTPGAYAYSDAGNGIGYSYLKIRGFPQRRIAVTINGIPLNDPESREVYWIDHPDLAASAQSIQVQRGVGATAYGTTALGGSVNVETVPFAQDRSLVLEAGAGSFGTQRYVVQAASGLLDEHWSTQARLSRILTDGYRQQSWSDLWSYFVALARVDKTMVTRFNLYGGPEETHLAYLGVPRADLDGDVTGDEDQDRRINPLTYKDERDHFFEPHYELLNDWKASPTVSVSNALFYFPGKGYYDEFREDRDLADYNYPSDPATDSTDIVRRRTVKNMQVGWVPRMRMEKGRYAFEAGLDLRYHEGRHYGELLWSAVQPANPEPDHVYYDYKGITINTSGFARQSWAFNERLRATLDLALHRQTYQLRDDNLHGLFFDQTYTFLTPRLGVNAIVHKSDEGSLRTLEAYASFSRSDAEPLFRELYDAENAGVPTAFADTLPSGELVDPILKPERVYDWDAGLRARGAWGQAELGGYYMSFRDEIVYNGQLTDNGTPITGNAAKSHHAGVEGAFTASVGRRFELRGSGHWSDDKFDDYQEYIDATTAIDYSGNRIAGYPGVGGRIAAAVLYRRARLELGVERQGTQYLDNTENERKDPAARQDPAYVDRTIEPWTTVDASLAWRMPGLIGTRDFEATLRAINLFDARYETAGYVDYPAPAYLATPVWIPAATRGIYLSVRASL